MKVMLKIKNNNWIKDVLNNRTKKIKRRESQNAEIKILQRWNEYVRELFHDER